MSERFWKNLSTALGWLSIGMLFGLVTFTSSLEIKDLDLWLHLRMGYWICHNGFVPNYDVLSCTISGKPWVNHEWLFQVLVYLVQKTHGFNGLISMQSFVVALTFLVLLFLGYSRDRQLLTVISLLMVLMVYQSRFTIRPDIFSLLFFVIDIYLLSLHLNKRWALYALVIIQILWSNMHGFFFFGPVLAGVGILSEFIKRRLPLPYEWNTAGRLNDEEYNSLKRIFPLLILASCVNPLTFKGAWYPLSVFFHLGGDTKIFFNNIVELQRPFTSGTVFTERYLYYKILIIVSAVSFVFNRRKVDISSLLIWALFLGFSLVAIRNLIYFAAAAYMVLMVNVISISWENLVPLRFTSFKFKNITGIACKLLLMLWMLNFSMGMMSNGYFDFDTYYRKSEFFGVSKRVYPYKAVDFLLLEKIKGNFFNDFNSGAYLIGRVSPNIKVFIDGRTEVYGANFFETYQKIWQAGNAKIFTEFERKHNITGAFLNNSHQQIPRGALKMFHSFKNWSIVYLDDDAVIFLKQTPYNKPFIDRLSVDLSKWKPKPMDLLRLGTKRVDPFPFTSRAYILEILGADEAAINESKEALRVAPDCPSAYNMMGKIYNKRKDYKKAFECYRLGTMYSGETQARLGLAQAYENLNEYNEAIGQYQRVIDVSPKDVQGYFGLARTYAEAGQDKKALDLVAQAPKLGLEDKVDVQKIHDIINKRKNKQGALKHPLLRKGVGST
ncbi:MAG: tetratricopeptide repeat protein [Candidatus Omnitrophica bacterium]|nr:tetratricopeptide repeat protein [Candidatus Omnitrophota bacterium]